MHDSSCCLEWLQICSCNDRDNDWNLDAGSQSLCKMMENAMDCTIGIVMPMQSSEDPADQARAETVITGTMSQFISGLRAASSYLL